MAKIYGTAADDNLGGTLEADIIYGFAGNDLISPGQGNDLVYGGDGDDRIYGGDGADTLYGQAGDDQLLGGLGNDALYGGAGNDYLYGDTGADTVYGRSGDDILVDSGDDYLDGGMDTDTLQIMLSGSAPVSFTFLAATPVTTPLGSVAVHFERIDITGGDGDDNFVGASGNDKLRGWIGNDVLRGRAGDDSLIGDNGDDILEGNLGNDMLLSGGGNDILRGGFGDDTLVGGSNFDVYPGDDTFDGGPGADHFVMVAFRLSTIDYSHSGGSVSVDLVQHLAAGGEAEGDSFAGSFFRVRLQGSAFSDTFVGGEQQFGGDGDDHLIVGPETQILSGEAGRDSFFFAYDPAVLYATPTVLDFDQAAHEILDVSQIDARPDPGDQAFTFIGLSPFSGAAGELRYQVDGDRTVVQMQINAGATIDASIVLQGAYALTAADFHL